MFKLLCGFFKVDTEADRLLPAKYRQATRNELALDRRIYNQENLANRLRIVRESFVSHTLPDGNRESEK
ncbi:hypothetical protein [Paraburkholderia unamae]|uniref:hypothetical protein n=1 Tax=Paraburkholderia unamae TaxID=219649 RepID=UPI0011BD86C9|nr:hypothetical protein [Paraburkholderia unamae]